MPFFILGASVLVALLIGGRALATADPRVVANIIRGAGGVGLGAFGLLMLLRGQVLIGSGAAGLAGVLLLRLFAEPAPRAASVETKSLRMSLEKRTGAMDGEVLTGAFAGRRLSELSRSELEALGRELDAARDLDASELLRAYVTRRFGRRGAQTEEGGAQPGGAMSRAQALKVLGLEEGAEPDEIRAAHRRMMLRAHPDQGGSAWLAAQVNQAKDVLLGD